MLEFSCESRSPDDYHDGRQHQRGADGDIFSLLPNDIVVVTTKRADPYALRPFATFAIIGTSKYAQHLTDNSTEAGALHAHGCLVARYQGLNRRGA